MRPGSIENHMSIFIDLFDIFNRHVDAVNMSARAARCLTRAAAFLTTASPTVGSGALCSAPDRSNHNPGESLARAKKVRPPFFHYIAIHWRQRCNAYAGAFEARTSRSRRCTTISGVQRHGHEWRVLREGACGAMPSVRCIPRTGPGSVWRPKRFATF
jgi:hypothetical protein